MLAHLRDKFFEGVAFLETLENGHFGNDETCRSLRKARRRHGSRRARNLPCRASARMIALPVRSSLTTWSSVVISTTRSSTVEFTLVNSVRLRNELCSSSVGTTRINRFFLLRADCGDDVAALATSSFTDRPQGRLTFRDRLDKHKLRIREGFVELGRASSDTDVNHRPWCAQLRDAARSEHAGPAEYAVGKRSQ